MVSAGTKGGGANLAGASAASASELAAIAKQLQQLAEAQQRIEQRLKRKDERERDESTWIARQLNDITDTLNAPGVYAVLTLTGIITLFTGVAIAGRVGYNAYQSLVQALPGKQWGEVSGGQQTASNWQSFFDGGSDSLIAIAVGAAEGTRTPDGGKTADWETHPDPGNGVMNQGSFSYQHGAASPEEADKKQLERLKGQMQEGMGKLKDVTPTPELILNFADLYNQSPAAASDFPKFLNLCSQKGKTGTELILCGRVESYQGDAPGITRNGITIEQDQRRRMGEIAKVIAQKQPALTTITAGEGSKTGWINPAPSATFTSGFGFRVHPIRKHTRCHFGIDLAAATGTPILAAKDGTVEVAGDRGDGFGLKIVLKHPDGSKSLYAHLSKINVSQGQQVKQGSAIGLMGSTGNSTGPHLHWEVDLGNGTIDPLPLLPEKLQGSQTFGKIDENQQCTPKRL